MNAHSSAGTESALMTLRRLARPRKEELCEFCSVPLRPGHRHLIEPATRKIICSCDFCALRFENVVGRWRLIPCDTFFLPDFQMADSDWDALAIPIQLAFFFYCTPAKRIVALYPSPAGATESLLPLGNWDALVSVNPFLTELRPDVEALLANRLGKPPAYFRAPIDVCFELIGLIRLHWRGLSGGEKLWREIDRFFAKLKNPGTVSPAEVRHA
jgi:hypothetical protein